MIIAVYKENKQQQKEAENILYEIQDDTIYIMWYSMAFESVTINDVNMHIKRKKQTNRIPSSFATVMLSNLMLSYALAIRLK